MNSPKRIARLAGVLYLIVAVCGGFAQLYVRTKVYVPGDAAATANKIVEHSALFRFGFVADLVMATSFILLAMVLYRLFKHVNKDVAAALVVFMAIGTGIVLVNLLYHFAALLVATGPSYTSGSDTLVLLLMDMHKYGYLIAGILFGLWLFPLGYLGYTSRMFPRALGVVLMIGCFSYLIDTMARFLLPDLVSVISTIVLAPAALAEFWMIGYLVLIGVRTRNPAPPG